MTTRRIVLGIDPGLADLGFGLAELTASGCRYMAHGAVHTDSGESDAARILAIVRALDEIIKGSAVTEIVSEAWVPYGGPQGRGGITQAVVGAMHCLAWVRGLPLHEMTAQAHKGITSGNRNCSKAETQAAVKKHFGLKVTPRPTHAADALSLVWAHHRLGDAVRTDKVQAASKFVGLAPRARKVG